MFRLINLLLAVNAMRPDSERVAAWKRLYQTILGRFVLLLLLQGLGVLVFSGIEWPRLRSLFDTAVVMLHKPLQYVLGVAGVLLISIIFRAWWLPYRFERGVGGKL